MIIINVAAIVLGLIFSYSYILAWLLYVRLLEDRKNRREYSDIPSAAVWRALFDRELAQDKRYAKLLLQLRFLIPFFITISIISIGFVIQQSLRWH